MLFFLENVSPKDRLEYNLSGQRENAHVDLDCDVRMVDLDSSEEVNAIVILQLNPRKPLSFACLVFPLTSLQMLAKKSIRSCRTWSINHLKWTNGNAEIRIGDRSNYRHAAK